MMQSQKTLTRIIFAWTIINVCYGQLIHTLPNQSIFLFPPDTNDIYSAFDVQHELSEILYAAGELLDWEAQYSDLNTILKSMWNVYNPEVKHD